MTLTTHVIVGAAVASFFPANAAGAVGVFCVAFASHFVLDVIPHWDYAIESASVDPQIGAKLKFDRALFKDMARIGGDALIGIVLSLVLFGGIFGGSARFESSWPLIILGAVAAILPDALQFAYAHLKHQPLISLQRFHEWIHTERRFKDSPVFGMVTQMLFLAAVVVVVKLLLALR